MCVVRRVVHCIAISAVASGASDTTTRAAFITVTTISAARLASAAGLCDALLGLLQAVVLLEGQCAAIFIGRASLRH